MTALCRSVIPEAGAAQCFMLQHLHKDCQPVPSAYPKSLCSKHRKIWCLALVLLYSLKTRVEAKTTPSWDRPRQWCRVQCWTRAQSWCPTALYLALRCLMCQQRGTRTCGAEVALAPVACGTACLRAWHWGQCCAKSWPAELSIGMHARFAPSACFTVTPAATGCQKLPGAELPGACFLICPLSARPHSARNSGR